MLCWATTSRPIVGSSRNSTSGECSRAAISSIFIRSPSDSSRTGCLSRWPTSSSSVNSSSVRSNCCGLDAVDLLVQPKRLLRPAGPTRAGSSGPSPGRTGGDRRCRASRARSPSRGRAGRRIDHAGEQLQRRRFAGAVGPQKRDELALLDVQVDAAHRVHLAVLATEQPADRGQQPLRFLINAIRFATALATR